MNCDYWAGLGECDKNPDYMLRRCCNACENNKSKGKYSPWEYLQENFVSDKKLLHTLNELVLLSAIISVTIEQYNVIEKIFEKFSKFQFFTARGPQRGNL